jgi:beta-D-xylosidase 4
MKMPSSTVVGVGLVAFGLPWASATVYPDCTNGPLSKTVVCDLKASPSDRAAALVKSMNISEKLVNLV